MLRLVLLALAATASASWVPAPEAPRGECPGPAAVYGKIQVVEHFADCKVKVVEHFEDLRVQTVEHFADKAGEWTMVEHFPDHTVTFVEHFPDFTIKYVEHFPGVNR